MPVLIEWLCAGSQDETSEAFIGEWAEKRGIRDQLVIATKVRCAFILFTSTPLAYCIPVHDELQARGPQRKIQSQLHREQCEELEGQRRSKSEKAAHDVHRHTLSALVGLEHFHRGGHG